MTFNHAPRLLIADYFQDKISQIDLICERALLESEQKDKHKTLNQVRINLIDRINSAQSEVFERFDQIESKHGVELLDFDEFKNEIFRDKYCYLLDIFEKKKFLIPSMIESQKLGVLIFSEYQDELLDNLRYSFHNMQIY